MRTGWHGDNVDMECTQLDTLICFCLVMIIIILMIFAACNWSPKRTGIINKCIQVKEAVGTSKK